MSAPLRWVPKPLDDGLRSVYGSAWDAAPPALTRVVAAVLVSGVVTLAMTSVSLLVAAEPWLVMAVVLTLLTVLVVVALAVSVLLLRGSRAIWILFVVLHVGALSALPREPWEVPAYLVTLAVLILLLAPGTIRAVWRSRPARYPAEYSALRRSD